MKHQQAVPVIATADVSSSVAYYTGVLGFTKHFVFGDPPVYAGVRRDDALIYITKDDKLAAALKELDLHPDVYLWVREVDKVFAEHKSRGAKVIEAISNRPWDARQYVIEDPNGYFIKIAEPLDDDE
jgi:uncharacterized glyoxalase superfamily protein PhnB